MLEYQKFNTSGFMKVQRNSINATAVAIPGGRGRPSSYMSKKICLETRKPLDFLKEGESLSIILQLYIEGRHKATVALCLLDQPDLYGKLWIHPDVRQAIRLIVEYFWDHTPDDNLTFTLS